MDAGTLDRRVAIQRATITTGASNEDVETWATVASRWASKHDVSDGERERAQAIGASVTTRFRVRHDSVTAAITAKDQLLCDGVKYAITGVKALDGRQEGFEITAVRRVDG